MYVHACIVSLSLGVSVCMCVNLFEVGAAGAFASVQFAGNPSQKSSIVRNSHSPEWNTELHIPVITSMLRTF